jgi:hypothetical protein
VEERGEKDLEKILQDRGMQGSVSHFFSLFRKFSLKQARAGVVLSVVMVILLVIAARF